MSKQKGGDYILAVKGNQKLLVKGIEASCSSLFCATRKEIAGMGGRK